ncbi:MAG: murein hydrolase activator EnvC family protein, partial [Egibacteraceae bacterium]
MQPLSRSRLHVVTWLALVVALIVPASAAASTPEEDRLEATKAKIAEVREELASAEQRKANDAAALAHAQRQLAVVNQALASAEAAVARQQRAVDTARAKLEELEQREAEQRDAMAERAVTQYKQGGASSFAALLAADGPRDVLRRSAFMNVVNRADARTIEDVTITQVAVDAQRQQLELEEESLRRVAVQQREIAAEAENLRDERALVLAATSQDVSHLQSQENHLEEESRELAAIARRASRQAAAARAAQAAAAQTSAGSSSGGGSSSPAPSSGGWTWPASGPATSEFGYRWGRLHAGLDIGAASGSPVYAARG